MSERQLDMKKPGRKKKLTMLGCLLAVLLVVALVIASFWQKDGSVLQNTGDISEEKNTENTDAQSQQSSKEDELTVQDTKEDENGEASDHSDIQTEVPLDSSADAEKDTPQPDPNEDNDDTDYEDQMTGDLDILDTKIGKSEHLELSSVYLSTIPNPDADNEYAENIASIEVKNTSKQYLKEAELVAEMSDGSKIYFEIKDVPPGEIAEVFDTENHSLSETIDCLNIGCVSETYSENDSIPNGIKLEASGSGMIVTNHSGSDLSNLKVTYHCAMGDRYFGGISYITMIESLNNGTSVEIVDNNIMGEVSIVRIDQ